MMPGGAAAVGSGWYWTLTIYIPLNNLLNILSDFDISLEGDSGNIDPAIINEVVSDITVVRIDNDKIVYPTEGELTVVHTTLGAFTFDDAKYKIENVANTDIVDLKLHVGSIEDPIVQPFPPEPWIAGLVVDYTYSPGIDAMVFTWAASIETIPGGPLAGAGVGAGSGGSSGGKGVGGGKFLHAIPHVGTIRMGFGYDYDEDEEVIIITGMSFSYSGLFETTPFIFIEGHGSSTITAGAIANIDTENIATSAESRSS
jgi:hypothetical protein